MKIANALPFIHAVELERALLSGNTKQVFSHFLWVLSYSIITTLIAIKIFLSQMNKQ